MSKPPLRVPAEGLAPGERPLPDDAAVYVTRVHRLAPGDPLLLFDPERGEEAEAVILEAGKRAVIVRVAAPRAARRPTREVTLIQGIGKGDKLDAVVRDATELGATRILPALCERSVARPDGARAARWRRVAVEAARQCGRGDIPAIGAPLSFAEALREARGEARIRLDPRAEGPLSAALLAAPSVVFAVGPEGGLSEREIAEAEEAGFVRASLGPRILRTETVCAAVLGSLLVVGVGAPRSPPC